MTHSLASPLLLVAMVFFALGLIRLIRVFPNEVTPFHLVFGLFLVECFFQFFPFVQIAEEVARPLSAQSEIFIVLASMTLFMGQFLARPGGEFKAARYEVSSVVPYWIMAPVMLAGVVVISYVNYRRLGTIPFYVLRPGEEYVGAEDAFLPFFTPLSWGLGRCLSIMVAFRLTLNNLPWRTFISRNIILLGCAFLAVIINTLDGMRNNLLLPIIIVLLGASRRFHFPLKRAIVVMSVFFVLFCLAGAMRVGKNDWKQTLRVTSGNRVVDTIAAWLISYTEPNLQNLDAMINSDPPLNYGEVTISEMLPGPVKKALFDAPDRASVYMVQKDLFVHQGLTYRTLYADIYTDFGYYGSLIVGAIVFFLSAKFYTKAGVSPWWFMSYLIVLAGIVFFPLMNFYLGITNLLPVALLFTIRCRRPRAIVEKPVRILEMARMNTVTNASV